MDNAKQYIAAQIADSTKLPFDLAKLVLDLSGIFHSATASPCRTYGTEYTGIVLGSFQNVPLETILIDSKGSLIIILSGRDLTRGIHH